MSREQVDEPAYLRPTEVFGFTKEEEAAYRVSNERFRQILDDEATTVHTLREDENNYGEFLFVTVSRPAPQGRALLTFYGLGHHWLREQWLTDTWSWYESNPHPETLAHVASNMEVEEVLRERLRDIEPYIAPHEPSEHAKLFAMLADMTDEDDAYATLQEMGDLDRWLGINFDE